MFSFGFCDQFGKVPIQSVCYSFDFCYHLLNSISLTLHQTNHIKQASTVFHTDQIGMACFTVIIRGSETQLLNNGTFLLVSDGDSGFARTLCSMFSFKNSEDN